MKICDRCTSKETPNSFRWGRQYDAAPIYWYVYWDLCSTCTDEWHQANVEFCKPIYGKKLVRKKAKSKK